MLEEAWKWATQKRGGNLTEAVVKFIVTMIQTLIQTISWKITIIVKQKLNNIDD